MKQVLINDKYNVYPKKYYNKISKIFLDILLTEKIEKKLVIELSIINSQEMKKLNLKYCKIKKTTDVLSFGSYKTIFPTSNLLGEIFIDFQQVRKQIENNQLEKNEFFMLFIHGVLHLLDYDHKNESEKKIMFDKQKYFLDTII